MDSGRLQSGRKGKSLSSIRRFYGVLAPRAYSVIMFAALFCTLAVKLFQAWRNGLVGEYVGWILADIAVLGGIEVILAIVCFRWPRRWVIRAALVFAAIVCTWSVMNAGWLIRTGTQILPSVLLPLIRNPLNSLGIIAVNLVEMPVTAVILLGPSAVALAFFFSVLVKAAAPAYNPKVFMVRAIISVFLVLAAVAGRGAVAVRGSPGILSAGLRSNCQLSAVMSLFAPDGSRLAKADFINAKRIIPAFDQVQVPLIKPNRTTYNIVIVVLEGIGYNYISGDLTPELASLASQGVEFANVRSTLTHTTKVLFSLLTGRFPSACQDLAETVPAAKPYCSLATILKGQLNFRTAFFQSAKGNFEGRPGLVYNLGFDKFWARDDLNNPNAFVGYLGCDEFSMLKPIAEWIRSGESPFLLTVLCSVTHDPYEVPQWFASPASREPVERYRQAISYTDTFIAALDAKLAELNVAQETIFCIIGDHGEAFAEHGLLGHERIAFDEVLRVPFVLRAPALVEPASKVTEPITSVDLTPTLLALLGFDISAADFDGVNGLSNIADDRKVYFSGWMQQSPAGFVEGNRKFVYNPMDKKVSVYDLNTDPYELVRMEPAEQRQREIAEEIISWRRNSIFRIDQRQAGKKMLFGRWLCQWSNRVCSAKYCPEAID